ncbi:TetR/AcrR family transcriptional regulator [Ethanoligenens harbinense]|uniref:Transcriptional regulator, TetR family n=1 Tax=Ethanoligenens harbinense (strain DSM 18485 / JCM 12961 / CGMCC 1.5033 / YUAN-3) TaxID=663278 RepID=E6U5F3_ETHHY|nr:TetR/AcrR family transcriptional regulator [Ethanoligenens harbinense]ADU25620.1 transcriptional regulator, TetR family [Ethanoligenens harbinense YUAN-3]
MNNGKPVRVPRQTRSLATKGKLLAAAKELFCEVGYYKTTANAIARKAGTAVGSFYAYFPDKEAVFAELMERLCQRLRTVLEQCAKQLRQPDFDPKVWIAQMARQSVEVYVSEPKFSPQIAVLYYNREPRVTAMMQREQSFIQQMIRSYFALAGDSLSIRDPEVSAVVVQKILIQLPEKVLYDWENIGQEEIINATIDLLQRYLTNYHKS